MKRRGLFVGILSAFGLGTKDAPSEGGHVIRRRVELDVATSPELRRLSVLMRQNILLSDVTHREQVKLQERLNLLEDRVSRLESGCDE